MLSLLASLATSTDDTHSKFLSDFFEGRLKKKGAGKPAARPHHHDDDIPSIWGSHPTGSAPHHLFRPCGTEARCWGRDPDSGEKLEPAQTSEAMLEINAAPHDAAQRADAYHVYVLGGTVEEGELVGCHVSENADEPWRSPMAYVREPGAAVLPNLTPLDWEHGRCFDTSSGELGVAFYATRRIKAGEELTACKSGGADAERGYESSCANAPMLRLWDERNRRVLAPRLHAPSKQEL